MFKVIAVMFAGVVVGYLLRKVRGVGRVSQTTMLTIILLLFFMGVEIGSNDNVMSNFASLGGEAAVIAVAGVLGSVVAAHLLYIYVFRKISRRDER